MSPCSLPIVLSAQDQIVLSAEDLILWNPKSENYKFYFGSVLKIMILL